MSLKQKKNKQIARIKEVEFKEEEKRAPMERKQLQKMMKKEKEIKTE